ncbi:MAG: hypothetical protein AAFY84_07135 [Pseudomonadota bacterium]
MKYFEWIEALSDIYLEDSYVLEIRERASEVEFEMEFVLRPGHVLYKEPAKDERYCYRRGVLRLSNCTDVQFDRSSTVSFDANNEIDLGNIYIFDREGDRISMSGDWGKLSLISDEVMVFIAL